MRGEYHEPCGEVAGGAELPPRARRIQTNLNKQRRRDGTTSACAENTPRLKTATRPPWNYLRVRGEYRTGATSYGGVLELPPRARRILRVENPLIIFRGTTSACAENTTRHGLRRTSKWNYLRVRGEYIILKRIHIDGTELPPRARRIHSFRELLLLWHGTTSACAENTTPQPHGPITSGNYLRVRGEYFNMHREHDDDEELPPRARRIPYRGQG